MTTSFGRRAFLASAAGAAVLSSATPARALGSRRGNREALQRRFTDWRFGMFLHFNMGTFHDAEWVDPDQDPRSFAPSDLDCGQWADAAKAAGMRFAVLTVKHHDGFCLWPSEHTSYDVMSSSYRRDVVGEFVAAFRSRGITPCLYFSIWDRTNGVTAPITRDMIEFVKGQLTELLTRYGPIPLLIFDGWAWQMGHQAVPFGEIRTHVAALQPDCLVLDLNGLTVPWDSDLLFVEEPKGGVFCPPGNTYAASQGQTISPSGWFWHPSTPANVLSADQIVDGHLKVLEPRYCTFILNCPPNPQGRLDDGVVATLAEVGRRWRPDASRPPLPAQPDVLRYPVTPVSAGAAFDGHSDFGWNGQADQTLWTAGPLPRSVTLDLGRPYAGIDTLTYLPRQDTESAWSFERFVTDGNITAHRISVSVDGATFRTVSRGSWAADHALKRARFRPATARYVRLEALSAVGGAAAIASELGCGGTDTRPRAV
jgi:alpha-L-fucosidase